MELAAQLDDAGTRSADAVARLWRAGELSAKKDGIGVYKVPLCLAVSGQHGLANNALDEIVASLQRSPGVFAPPPLPDGVVSPDKVTNLLSEYRTYFDAVILAGACATQRWDIVSDAAIAELLSRQHGPTGGFMKKAGDANPLMALSVTCMTGMVLIARGRIAEARRAAAFVQRVIAANGDPSRATHFRFVGTADGGVVNAPTGWLAARCLFEVDVTSKANRFYHVGISAAFLAELHALTKEASLLKSAEAALTFAERLPAAATACDHICKVGWGAALVYRETGNPRWAALASKVARETFLGKQQLGGLYPDFVSVMSDEVPVPHEVIGPGTEIAAEFSYEMHFIARGLSAPARAKL